MNGLRSDSYRRFRFYTSLIIIVSFIFQQISFADHPYARNPYAVDQSSEEGFQDPNLVETSEAWRREQLKQMNELRESVELEGSSFFKGIEETRRSIESAQEINEMNQGLAVESLRQSSQRLKGMIESYGEKYIKYGDGKKIWMKSGLVTAIENERIYDKKGNLSIRNRWGMKYDESKQLVSYEEDILDSLGNVLKTKWQADAYWTEADEHLDSRRKAGMLSGYTVENTNEIGVTTKTRWHELTYYTEADEGIDAAKVSGQMASYSKEEVSEATPERVDYIFVNDIEYLKREKIIEERSDDPKDAKRRRGEAEKYDVLTTGFHEERTTFGVTTEREWRNAVYNAYSELVYYTETSTTLGIKTEKVFDWATYDTYGRMISFQETTRVHGVNSVRVRRDMRYNDQNQLLSYEDEIREDGITTLTRHRVKKFNEFGQEVEYVEVTETSEGFERELTRSDIRYDKRGLITQYRDNYFEGGLAHEVYRYNMRYNRNGFLESWQEKHRELGMYSAPDGDVIRIDRYTFTERIKTSFNKNGLESSFEERITDPIGLITEVRRFNIAYSGRNITAYEEERRTHGTLSQNVLKVSNLDQFIPLGGDYDATQESIVYEYTIHKKFYGASYKGSKLTGYTEEITDSRQAGNTVVTHRYNQQYGSNGKVTAYSEDVTTQSGAGQNAIHREWSNGLYDAFGRLLSYTELTRNAMGFETLLDWHADLYNPIYLVQEFTQTITQGGHSITTGRTAIKYDEFDRQMYYRESILDHSSGLTTQKTWQTGGYNSVGLINDYTEITIKGQMTETLTRHHIVYNSLGLMRQFIQDLNEQATYADALGNIVNINRDTLLERIETYYDPQGRENEFKEYSLNPLGMETRTHRSDIQYFADGNIASYLETSTISSSFLNDTITNGNPPAVGAGANVNYQYTVTRSRNVQSYDGQNNIVAYTEYLTDSRKPGLTVTLSRQNQQYTPSRQLTHYEESLAQFDGSNTYINQTVWNGAYNAAGLLISSSEILTDFLGTTRVNMFEAVNFNPIDLVLESREISYIDDSGSEIQKTILEKSQISYDAFDRRVYYSENELNRNGTLLKNSVWQNVQYYDGTDLLRRQQTVTTQGTLVTTQTELTRVYNDKGQLVDNLTHTLATAPNFNSSLQGDALLLENGLAEAIAIQANPLNPLSLNVTGNTLTDLLSAAYSKESYSRHQVNTINTQGLVENYTDTFFDIQGGSVTERSETNRVMNASQLLIDGRSTAYLETVNVFSSNPGAADYTLTKDVIQSFDPTRGLTSSLTEIITDTRRGDGISSDWLKTTTRNNMTYDIENRLFAYTETQTERNQTPPAVLDTFLQIDRSSTQYFDDGKEMSFTETRQETFGGYNEPASEEVTVTTLRQWSGTYNQAGLMDTFIETNTNGNAKNIQERLITLYDSEGRVRASQDKNTTDADAVTDKVVRNVSLFNTAYDANGEHVLSSVTLTHTEGFDTASLVSRDNVIYAPDGFLTQYTDSFYEFGPYFINSYAGQTGPMGVSNTANSVTTRQNQMRNNLGQITGYDETVNDIYNIQTNTIRRNIEYSARGQEVYYEEDTSVTALGLSYSVSKNFATLSFNAMGLPDGTQETTFSDSRRSGITNATLTKNNMVYGANQLLTSYNQVLTEQDSGGLFDTYSQTLRTDIQYSNGSMIHYFDTNTNRIALTSANGWTTTTDVVTTDEWTVVAFDGNSPRVTESTLENTSAGLQTLTIKRNISFNVLGQETSFETEVTDPSGFSVLTQTSGITYNALNQQTGYETTSTVQGMTTRIRRTNQAYDNSGRMTAYSETRLETDSITPIDRIFVTQRSTINYNTFGQLMGYTESAFMPFTRNDIGVVVNNFTGNINTDADVLDILAADMQNHIQTDTVRSNSVYTPQNQLIGYQESIRTYGTLSQNVLSDGDSYQFDLNATDADPDQQITASLQVQGVDQRQVMLFNVNAFDISGRQIDTTQSLTVHDTSNNPLGNFTQIRKYDVVFDGITGREASYVTDTWNSDDELNPSLLDKRMVQTRSNIQYTVSGKLSSYEDTIMNYMQGTLLETITKDWTGTYYANSDQLYSSIENSVLNEAPDADMLTDHEISGLRTRIIREGLDGAGLAYNELGQELSSSELTFQYVTDNTGTIVSYIYPSLVRRTNQTYNSLGKLVSYVQEKGNLITAVLLNSAYDAGSSNGLMSDYDLVEQVEWKNGAYDQRGQLVGYHQEVKPLGIITGFSDVSTQQAELFDLSVHTFFTGVTINDLGQVTASRTTTWEYLNPGLSRRSDVDLSNVTYDAYGRLTTSTETTHTRQGDPANNGTDKTDSVVKNVTYTGIRQTAIQSTISFDPSFQGQDERRTYSGILYNDLNQQINFTYQMEEDTVGGFVAMEAYGRTSIIYDARGRLYSYTDTYTMKNGSPPTDTLQIVRRQTLYHDGNFSASNPKKTLVESGEIPLVDTRKGKIFYTEEQVTEDGETVPREFSYSYFDDTGLLDEEIEYLSEWRLVNASLDVNNPNPDLRTRYLSYTAFKKSDEGDFRIIKNAISYDPALPLNEIGWTGDIARDLNLDGDFLDAEDLSFQNLSITGISYDGQGLDGYSQSYRDDLDNNINWNDVTITKSNIQVINGVQTYHAQVDLTNDLGQIIDTFYIQRTILPEDDNLNYFEIQDIYTDASFIPLSEPSTTRIYRFDKDAGTNPPKRLISFSDEITESGITTQTDYTAVWNNGVLEDLNISGGSSGITYSFVRYYRWWEAYPGKISQFNSGTDQYRDLTWNGDTLTGYRLLANNSTGEPEKIFSNLNDPAGFTLETGGQVFSGILPSLVNNTLVGQFTYNGGTYTNLVYDTNNLPAVLSFDLSAGGQTFTNVTLTSGRVSSYTTLIGGNAVTFSNITYAGATVSGYTRTEGLSQSVVTLNAQGRLTQVISDPDTSVNGNETTYNYLSYSGNNLTQLSVVGPGNTTTYQFGGYQNGNYTTLVINNGGNIIEIRGITRNGSTITQYELKNQSSANLFGQGTETWQQVINQNGTFVFSGDYKVEYSFGTVDNNRDGQMVPRVAKYDVISTDNQGRVTEFWVTAVDYPDITTAPNNGSYPRLIQMRFDNVTYDNNNRITGYTVEGRLPSPSGNFNIDQNFNNSALTEPYSVSNVQYNGLGQPVSYDYTYNNGPVISFDNATYTNGILTSYDRNGVNVWSASAADYIAAQGVYTDWVFEGTTYQNASFDGFGGIIDYDIQTGPQNVNVNSEDRYKENLPIGNHPEFNLELRLLNFNIQSFYNAVEGIPSNVSPAYPANAALAFSAIPENYAGINSVVPTVIGNLNPLTELGVSNNQSTITRYAHIERETLLHEMQQFSKRKVVTKEYLYDVYGLVTGIITTTTENDDTVERVERLNIKLDRFGRQVQYVETITDRFNQIKVITRLDTQFDERGNVKSYTQVIETQKILTGRSEITDSLDLLDENAFTDVTVTDPEALLGEPDSEVILTAVERITETIDSQIYNDKRQLLSLTKLTEIEKTGQTDTGRSVTYFESQNSRQSFSYNDFGQINQSVETFGTSFTPGLQTTTIKQNIGYESGREVSFELSTNELVHNEEGQVLSDTTQFTQRLNTSYDRFGRIRSSTEERSRTGASQIHTVMLSNVSYDALDRRLGYSEYSHFEGSSHTQEYHKAGITYNRYGQEMTYKQVMSEKDPSIAYQNTMVSERQQTTIDAFGNLTQYLERSLNLLSHTISPSTFFNGGIMPDGVVSQIIFNGGHYDETGRMTGSRISTGTAYGSFEFSGPYQAVSVVDRTSQTIDSAGRLTSYSERSWNSASPDVVATTLTSGIQYNDKGQKISETTLNQSAGQFNTNGSLQTVNHSSLKTMHLITYDDFTGRQTGSHFTLENYAANETYRQIVHEDILNQSDSGKTLTVLRKTRHQTSDQSGDVSGGYDEASQIEYTYDENGNVTEENIQSTLTENNQVISETFTTSQKVYDSQNRVTEELSRVDNKLRNKGRLEQGLNTVIDTTHTQQEYYQNGLIKHKVTVQKELNPLTGQESKGQLTLENDIRYAGHGGKVSWSSAVLNILSNIKNAPGQVAGLLTTNLNQLGNKGSGQLSVPQIQSLMTLSIANVGEALRQGDVNAMPLLSRGIKIPETQTELLKTLEYLGLSVEDLEIDQFSQTEVTRFNSDGKSHTEVTGGTRILKHAEFPLAVSFSETKSDIQRNAEGRIISFIQTSSQTGRVDETLHIKNRSYNGAGQIISETSAVPTGVSPEGYPGFSTTVKENITYNYENQVIAFSQNTTNALGITLSTRRLDTTYDMEGKMTGYTQLQTDATHISDKNILFENPQEQAVSFKKVTFDFDAYGNIKTQTTDQGNILEGDPLGQLTLRPKTQTTVKETFSHDVYGRVVRTESESTNGFNETTVSTTSQTLDEQGRVVESQTFTQDHEGIETTRSQQNIQYNDWHQKTSWDDTSTDKNGHTSHSRTFDVVYNAAGQIFSETSQDFEDSYKANTNPVTTSHIEYDAFNRRTAYMTSGLDKNGQSFSETRSAMTYNLDGELVSYSSSGQNNGYAYSYTKSNIEYYQRGDEGKEGQIKSYTETGVSSDGQRYTETHSNIKYDDEGRKTSETVEGKRAGKAFSESKQISYYAEGHQYEGEVFESITTSNNSKETSTTQNLNYDVNGNVTHSSTEGVDEKGKSFTREVTKTFALVAPGIYRETEIHESGRSNGKNFNSHKTNIRYDSSNRMYAFKEKGSSDGKSYSKNISKTLYNALGQKVSQTFTDSRNDDFKSSSSKTLTETYSYDKEGGLKESKLTTPDYIVRFDGKSGKQIGDVQETASFKAYKEAEIKAARKKAEKEARKKAEAAYAKGVPGSQVLIGPDGNPASNAGSGMNFLDPSVAKYLGGSPMALAMYNPRTRSLIPGAPNMTGQLTAQNLPIAAILPSIPQANMGSFNEFLSKELAKIKITNPTLDTKAVTEAVKNAIKLAIPDLKKSLAILGNLDAKLKAMVNVDLSKVALTKAMSFAPGQGKEIALGSDQALIQELQNNLRQLGDLQTGKDTQQLINDFGFMMPTLAIPPGYKLATYDENGNLKSLTTMESETSADGTVHSKQVIEEYKDGYVTDTRIMETFKGPNMDVTVETTFGKDGSTIQHITGKEKSEASGQWVSIDETRISSTKATSNGFKTTTQITDNLTGLQSTKIDTYSGVKYSSSGEMIEFKLHSVHTGQVQSWNPESKSYQTTDIHKESTVRQYASKLDSEGRLVSFKQDLWDNSSPDKRTTQQTDILAFDSNNRAFEQVTQTWEKGSSVDGNGNRINLDSYSVAHRSQMQYNSAGRLTSYNETTYTQEQLKDTVQPNAPNGIRGGKGSDLQGQVSEFEGQNNQKLNPRTMNGALESFVSAISGDKTSVSIGGNSYASTEGYGWSSTNSSRSGISYDYAGRTSFYLNADAKANHTNYNHMDMEVASKKAGVITRNVAFDGVGRQVYNETKDTTGEQSINGQHWKDYNSLGQVIKETSILRSDGKKFSMTKHTETTYTYDKMGIQDKIKETVYKDSQHNKTTVGQVVTIVVAIVATVLTCGAAAGAIGLAATGISATAAAAITAAGAMAGALIDGASFGDALKAGVIAFATAYFAPAGIGEGFTKIATTFLARTALNTGVNILRGMEFDQALKFAAITAAAMGLAEGTAEALASLGENVGGQFGDVLQAVGKGLDPSTGTLSGSNLTRTQMAIQEISRKGMEQVIANNVDDEAMAVFLNTLSGMVASGIANGEIKFDSEVMAKGAIRGVIASVIENNRNKDGSLSDFAMFAEKYGNTLVDNFSYADYKTAKNFLSNDAASNVIAGKDWSVRNGNVYVDDPSSPDGQNIKTEYVQGSDGQFAKGAKTVWDKDGNITGIINDQGTDILQGRDLRETDIKKTVVIVDGKSVALYSITDKKTGNNGQYLANGSFTEFKVDSEGKVIETIDYNVNSGDTVTTFASGAKYISNENTGLEVAIGKNGNVLMASLYSKDENGNLDINSLNVSLDATSVQINAQTNMVEVFIGKDLLESFPMGAKLVRDGFGNLVVSSISDGKGNIDYFKPNGQLKAQFRVAENGDQYVWGENGQIGSVTTKDGTYFMDNFGTGKTVFVPKDYEAIHGFGGVEGMFKGGFENVVKELLGNDSVNVSTLFEYKNANGDTEIHYLTNGDQINYENGAPIDIQKYGASINTFVSTDAEGNKTERILSQLRVNKHGNLEVFDGSGRNLGIDFSSSNTAITPEQFADIHEKIGLLGNIGNVDKLFISEGNYAGVLFNIAGNNVFKDINGREALLTNGSEIKFLRNLHESNINTDTLIISDKGEIITSVSAGARNVEITESIDGGYLAIHERTIQIPATDSNGRPYINPDTGEAIGPIEKTVRVYFNTITNKTQLIEEQGLQLNYNEQGQAIGFVKDVERFGKPAIQEVSLDLQIWTTHLGEKGLSPQIRFMSGQNLEVYLTSDGKLEKAIQYGHPPEGMRNENGQLFKEDDLIAVSVIHFVHGDDTDPEYFRNQKTDTSFLGKYGSSSETEGIAYAIKEGYATYNQQMGQKNLGRYEFLSTDGGVLGKDSEMGNYLGWSLENRGQVLARNFDGYEDSLTQQQVMREFNSLNIIDKVAINEAGYDLARDFYPEYVLKSSFEMFTEYVKEDPAMRISEFVAGSIPIMRNMIPDEAKPPMMIIGQGVSSIALAAYMFAQSGGTSAVTSYAMIAKSLLQLGAVSDAVGGGIHLANEFERAYILNKEVENVGLKLTSVSLDAADVLFHTKFVGAAYDAIKNSKLSSDTLESTSKIALQWTSLLPEFGGISKQGIAMQALVETLTDVGRVSLASENLKQVAAGEEGSLAAHIGLLMAIAAGGLGSVKTSRELAEGIEFSSFTRKPVIVQSDSGPQIKIVQTETYMPSGTLKLSPETDGLYLPDYQGWKQANGQTVYTPASKIISAHLSQEWIEGIPSVKQLKADNVGIDLLQGKNNILQVKIKPEKLGLSLVETNVYAGILSNKGLPVSVDSQGNIQLIWRNRINEGMGAQGQNIHISDTGGAQAGNGTIASGVENLRNDPAGQIRLDGRTYAIVGGRSDPGNATFKRAPFSSEQTGDSLFEQRVKKGAETSRAEAETSRAEAETSRAEAETSRAEAETIRRITESLQDLAREISKIGQNLSQTEGLRRTEEDTEPAAA